MEGWLRRLALTVLRTAGSMSTIRPFVWLLTLMPAEIKFRIRGGLVKIASGSQKVGVKRATAGAVVTQDEVPSLQIIETRHYEKGARGVNLIGYMRGGLGLAENARSFARALAGERFPLSLIEANVLESERNIDDSLNLEFDAEAKYEIDIYFINPDRLASVLHSLGSSRARYRIGYWFWELECVPKEWLPAIELVDEIWVSSKFVRDAFLKVTNKPITLIPMVVEVSAPNVGSKHLSEDGGRVFTFLHSFDFYSFIERKNPRAVIAAFQSAFPLERKDVHLIIKSTHGDVFRDQFYDLLSAATKDSRISIQDGFITRKQMLSLMDSVDAYVSLHRSEGFGLGLAESMYLGKPVIGTAYSGNMEYMTSENSCLVDFALVNVKLGDYMHTEGQHWAEANITSAAMYMRSLADDIEKAVKLGRRAASDIRLWHSPQRCTEVAIRRLHEIHQKLDGVGIHEYRADSKT